MGLFDAFKKKKEEALTPQERRTVPRWPVVIQTKVSWEGQEPFECVIDNINFKGFRITMPVMFSQSLVKLKIHLSPDFILSLDGMTLWYRAQEKRHCYGVLITRMRSDDRERLSTFIRQNYPDVVEKRVKE